VQNSYFLCFPLAIRRLPLAKGHLLLVNLFQLEVTMKNAIFITHNLVLAWHQQIKSIYIPGLQYFLFIHVFCNIYCCFENTIVGDIGYICVAFLCCFCILNKISRPKYMASLYFSSTKFFYGGYICIELSWTAIQCLFMSIWRNSKRHWITEFYTVWKCIELCWIALNSTPKVLNCVELKSMHFICIKHTCLIFKKKKTLSMKVFNFWTNWNFF